MLTLSASLSSCNRGLTINRVIESLAFDIGSTDEKGRQHDWRLHINGDGIGSYVDIYFRNSNSQPLEVAITPTAPIRVSLTPVLGGDSRIRQEGDRTFIQVRGNNAEAVGLRVRALSVGEMGRPGQVLRVESSVQSTTFQFWIEPSEGQWGSTLDLGIVAVHAALMRNGRNASVVFFSPPRVRDQNGNVGIDHSGHGGGFMWGTTHANSLETRLWDLRINQLRSLSIPCPRNLFCSGHAHLPDGRLFVAGGHIHQGIAVEPGTEPWTGHIEEPGDPDCLTGDAAERVHLFDFQTGLWSVHPGKMRQKRWYPTVTTMPDGRMLITSGSGGTLAPNPWNEATGYYGLLRKDYELFDPARNELVTPSPPQNNFITAEHPETYPGVYVLPSLLNGMVSVIFAHERNRGWLFKYTSGALSPLERMDREFRMSATVGNRSYPHYGSSVLLPLDANSQNARVLLTGGQNERNGDHRDQSRTQLATNTAEIFEFRTAATLAQQPGFRAIGRMNVGRFLHDATLLPDGKVLISGGSSQGWANLNSGNILRAELFDPQTESFTLAASATLERRYHSTALLLPDATVMKAGSTGGFDVPETIVPIFRAERFFPPYLWRNQQPLLIYTATNDAPITYASTVNLTVESKDLLTAKFALMRLGSVTHGNNMDQRLIWLPEINRVTGQDNQVTFTLQTPRDSSIAPPGDYMIFAIDSFGVPSTAHFLTIR
ncbi:MAG: galactose oxidase-like domain-containing protein [Bacteroidota bacterium]